MQKVANKLNVNLIFCYSFLFFFLLVCFAIYNDYKNNYLIYFVYSISINILFFISFFRGALLTMFFFFTWLGLWFKVSLPHILNYYFNISMITPNLREAVQYFDIFVDNKIVEEIMLELSIIFFLLSIILFLFKRKKNYLASEKYFLFSINNKILYIIIALLVMFNFVFGVYHKGFFDQFFNYKLLSLFFKFLYYFLPNYFLFELWNYKKENENNYKKFFLIIIFINFFLYTSMLSREYILFSLILFGYIFVDKKMKIDLFFLSKISMIFFILFLLNIKLTSELRFCKMKNFEEKSDYSINLYCLKNSVNSLIKKKNINKKLTNSNDLKYMNFSKTVTEFISIASSRWVGLESIYLKKINFEFLEVKKSALTNQNFIPGIYYLLYNQNIYLFTAFSGIFCLCLILINQILLKYSLNHYQYIFFCYLLSYRIFHSGISDVNTAFFIIVILLISIIVHQFLSIEKK